MDVASKATRARWLTVLTAALGCAVCLGLVMQSGADAVRHGLARVAGMLPIVLLLEAARVAAETWSTRALLGINARLVPATLTVRAQLLSSALSAVMPAGRALGESAKAAVLHEALPLAPAAATGALGQLLVLLVNGALCFCGSALAAGYGAEAFALACVVLGTVMWSAVLSLALAARSAAVARWLARFRLTARWSGAFLAALRHGEPRFLQAGCAQLLARGLQLAQLALLALALGHAHALRDAPMLQAIYLLGASAGDLVPAQLGATDAAFGLARPLLSMTPPNVVALGLALHAIQLAGAGACFFAALFIRRTSGITPSRTRTHTWET